MYHIFSPKTLAANPAFKAPRYGFTSPPRYASPYEECRKPRRTITVYSEIRHRESPRP